MILLFALSLCQCCSRALHELIAPCFETGAALQKNPAFAEDLLPTLLVVCRKDCKSHMAIRSMHRYLAETKRKKGAKIVPEYFSREAIARSGSTPLAHLLLLSRSVIYSVLPHLNSPPFSL